MSNTEAVAMFGGFVAGVVFGTMISVRWLKNRGWSNWLAWVVGFVLGEFAGLGAFMVMGAITDTAAELGARIGLGVFGAILLAPFFNQWQKQREPGTPGRPSVDAQNTPAPALVPAASIAPAAPPPAKTTWPRIYITGVDYEGDGTYQHLIDLCDKKGLLPTSKLNGGVERAIVGPMASTVELTRIRALNLQWWTPAQFIAEFGDPAEREAMLIALTHAPAAIPEPALYPTLPPASASARQTPRVMREAHPSAGPAKAGAITLPCTFSFDYRDQAGNQTSRVVTVHSIRSSDKKLYLQGFCHQHKEERTFRVANILGMLTDMETGELISAKRLLSAACPLARMVMTMPAKAPERHARGENGRRPCCSLAFPANAAKNLKKWPRLLAGMFASVWAARWTTW